VNRRKTQVISIISIIFILFISCSSSNKTLSKNGKICNENFNFKKIFFQNIQNVENLIYEVQGESLLNSLKFIGKYTEVNFESMSNYGRTYPAGIFIEDKKIWLKWYEDHKCQNIQLKE
jgi:hypothetical protein